ncbi:hypothetical protein CC80DRAFT_499042 [Byssothecium circinans]|uniref:Uncharacterized protein n=1 Tax=Byssothecium circinans TaxID=147558 RepID=A0A6A5UG10_9PLEO|nr:hypothetical protein CC80DRAFT_499042 [Byssothecium circinans]
MASPRPSVSLFLLAALFLALFALQTTAAPVFRTLPPSENLTARPAGQPAGLYSCSGPKFTGTCHYWPPSQTSSYHCYPVPDSEIENRSWGPDEGGACKLFTSGDCNEDTRYYMPNHQGKDGDIWRFPGDDIAEGVKIRSLWCYKT